MTACTPTSRRAPPSPLGAASAASRRGGDRLVGQCSPNFEVVCPARCSSCGVAVSSHMCGAAPVAWGQAAAAAVERSEARRPTGVERMRNPRAPLPQCSTSVGLSASSVEMG
ncbi:hypothetical protein AB1Y20_014490 [Prymnesium parvum]|uniref:Uncharacterized protein n=1 Tax=Prymnesium parvum TaxID=97485 RepID=A0AB34IEV6_PRYPA